MFWWDEIEEAVLDWEEQDGSPSEALLAAWEADELPPDAWRTGLGGQSASKRRRK